MSMTFRDALHSTAPWWRMAMDRKQEAELESRYASQLQKTLGRLCIEQTQNRQQSWLQRWLG